MRRDAREAAYKLIFEYIFTKQLNQRTLQMFLSAQSSDDDREYLQSVVNGVIGSFDQLTERIMQHAKDYTSPDRLNTSDYAALLLGSYELLDESVPVAVAINEAVNLSKEYGGEKSSGFVNGVLASINRNR